MVLATFVTLGLIAADNKMLSVEKPTARPDTEQDIFDNPASLATQTPATATDTPTPAPTAQTNFLQAPARTVFLLVGPDKDKVLTDALMAGCFYRDTCEIKLMSIPRDTYTLIPEERLSRMRADGLKPPASGVMKINALHSYGGGRSYGLHYLMEQLGEMLGVQFQYYVEVDLTAFKKIVDVLGGVEMEIPKGGLYYDDPVQNLHIAIPEGRQFINGDQAEGVVRFRRYPTGDVGRNAMQMEFMKQLFKQVLTRDAIMSDPMAIIDIILNDVRSNIGADLIKYAPYATKLTADSISTHAMPGEGAYSGAASYFFPDTKALAQTVNEVFYRLPDPVTPDGN